MKLSTAVCSDIGLRRQANEDSYATAAEIGLWLVADGMGGHKAGKLASELATRHALRAVQALRGDTASPAEKLRQAVSCANREIHQRAESRAEFSGMGTTLVAVLATHDRVALAHVGDSRAYLIRAGRIRQLTDDHSLVADLLRRDQISEAAAREHPHRHVLTRALGVAKTAEPDLAELTPASGDTLVLCSDGLTNHLRDAEILEHVRREPALQKACDGLVASANQRGGIDNITVVLVRFEDDEDPSA
jgi:serine/threonine protein phosphatase PrpC